MEAALVGHVEYHIEGKRPVCLPLPGIPRQQIIEAVDLAVWNKIERVC